MNRRELIALLGSTAALSRPLSARAQQPERMRRVGVLMNAAVDDAQAQAHIRAFRQALHTLGWLEGRNIQLETRWAAADPALTRQYAGELVAFSAELILAAGLPQAVAVYAVSQTMPVVFAQSIDPVGAGLVKGLARPGGNSTGFTQFEYGLSGKWPQLLKEIAPRTKRAAVLRDPSNPAGIGQWAVLQAMAPAVDMELTPISLLDVDAVKEGITAMASSSGGGLIVPASAQAVLHRKTIVEQAAAHRLPAVYPYRSFVAEGGLLSYGPDLIDQYKGAANYVDRILKGEKPADLPVQAPTKYELVINVKTAKAVGLDVPATLLARADEVIE